MMFDKQNFLKENTINKTEWVEKKGLFISDLTIKEKFLVDNSLFSNSVKENDKFRINEESYFHSICLRVSFGLVDKDGNKVFTLEEIQSLKDKSFIDAANEKIIEVNSVKK